MSNEKRVICSVCGNNACLLDPWQWLRRHGDRMEKELVSGVRVLLEEYLRERMKAYEASLRK